MRRQRVLPSESDLKRITAFVVIVVGDGILSRDDDIRDLGNLWIVRDIDGISIDRRQTPIPAANRRL